jgi:hypothetical protein
MTRPKTEREAWIEDEITNAIDAGCFEDRDDPECIAYADQAAIIRSYPLIMQWSLGTPEK